MEINSVSGVSANPKLTDAEKLKTKPSFAGAAAATGAIDAAANNNQEAATDITRLSSSQDTASVAAENQAASRVDPKNVSKFAEDLGARIVKNPDQAMASIKPDLNASVVKALLS